MNTKAKQFDTGVIIGRFQVAELHEAHKALIDTVIAECENVIILLGLSAVTNTKKNPLDYQQRRQMIRESYPDLDLGYIKDTPNDETWSVDLDAHIKDRIPNNHSVALYGSRDSFIAHYTGDFNTVELEPKSFVSGTEERNRISKRTKTSYDFRSGMISAAFQRYATSYQTVDIAVWNKETKEVLLGRKPNEKQFRYIGGFVDPADSSLENAAIRELKEEAGELVVKTPEYIGSFRIDDWRYRSESDKIMTTLFLCEYQSGTPKPADDIAEVRWVSNEELTAIMVVPEHKTLTKALLKKLAQK